MKEKQEFKVRVRQYEDGKVFALSHYEIDEEGADLDEISSDGGGSYREFDLVLTATPPGDAQDVAVDVPDDADTVAVDVPDAVPA